jgi:hypothetical protein
VLPELRKDTNETKGIWVSQTEFVHFAESPKTLSEQIATRSRSIDFYGLGMYLPNPDPVLKALGKDIKVYKELRSDAHVGGCIRRRKASVKALEWGVDKDKAKTMVPRISPPSLRIWISHASSLKFWMPLCLATNHWKSSGARLAAMSYRSMLSANRPIGLCTTKTINSVCVPKKT